MISTPDKNIVLIGFMASGKSHLGRIIADELGFELIDLDAVIEEEEGQSIKNIFAQAGEAYFRDREYKTLKKLERSSSMVLVTGGGTPTHFASAQILPRIGMIFFLDASFELVKKRLKRSNKRPLGLVSSEEEVVKLYELYRFRRPLYQTLGQTISVDKEDAKSFARDIISRFTARNELNSLRHIRVEDAHHPYDIHFGENALTRLPEVLSSLGLSNRRVAIVTSNHLTNVLKPKLEELLASFNPKPVIIPINDGEEHKNLNSISLIHDQLFKHGFTRSSLIIALGGGTVGDVAGFAASIYMRGLPLIQVPTTLLAMVDSSVGGKTGVDVSVGKNLIGSFHMPKAVIIDPSLLLSLPKEEYACGMAETIKHAIIGDKELFYELLSLSDISLLERAVLVKVRAVIEDPYEHHRRAHLNLGHTFAHAIEKASDYRIKHGQAVAIGLMLATKLSKRLSILEEDFEADLKSLLTRYELPHTLPQNLAAQTLLEAMQHDKKRDQLGLRFILPERLGQVSIRHVPEEVVLELLNNTAS
ncbi:MAG TPA: 3-dehydroquinate synthase [Myxococcota bacterium]|nr:3-dehydroquinate synthase [Myxococcota bacterium]